jgi:4-amino-4-deoxy-L-arabinose transferase-like glycosyltransferase
MYICASIEVNIMKWPGSKKYFWIFIAICVLSMAAYISGLFVDVTRDGSKYATVAREVYESGDFIHLKVHGEPYDQKPPMLFWLSALSFYVFGLSNFAFKLPLLLLGFWGLYSTYRLGKSLYNHQVGLIAATLLATSQVYFLYYMDIHTDSVLQPFVTFSLWQLFDFIKTRRNINFVLGFAGIGMAMLSKGPVGAVVPAFAVVGHLIFTRQHRRLLDIRWYIGAVGALLIIIPALVGLFNQFGWEGIRFYFWTNNVGRLSGSLGANRNDYFFFVHNLFYLFFPWAFLLFVSTFFEFRSLILRKFRSRELFLFSGIWFFFIILSISKGKLPNYIFILIPLFSILTAKYIFVALSDKRPGLFKLTMKLQSISVILALILLLALSVWVFPLNSFWLWSLLILAVVLLIYVSMPRNPTGVRLLMPSMILIAALNFIINFHVAPQIFSDQASVKAAIIFNELAGPDEKIHNYNYESHELYFYAKRPVKKVINDLTVIALMQEPGNWVLTERKVVERLEGDYPKPEIFPLEHVWLNKLNIKYLNPDTRGQSRDTLFLMRSSVR